MVAGIGLLVWAFWIWRWGDPFTARYTHGQQKQLAREYRALERRYAQPPPAVSGGSGRTEPVDIAHLARRFRATLPEGAPIGRLRVPALGLDAIVVNGTDTASLKRGPGRDPRTAMPGEGRLVYIAGHRTTYAAPFAHIDRLQPGDRITLTTPYATFAYTVRDHRIVPSDALGVLRSRGREELVLQACHPRFFATQRYLVDARPVSITPHRADASTARAAAAPRSRYAEMTTGVPGSARA